MYYYMRFEKQFADPTEFRTTQWPSVKAYLQHSIERGVIRVLIVKYSEDLKVLAEKTVTMSNLWKVANALTDKVLKEEDEA